MPESFLDVLQREGADCPPKNGENRGLPTGRLGEFLFATGIECSYPKVKGARRDLLEETGHDRRYAEDLALVRDLGLRVLRYGLPYHRTNPARGVYDWAWADLAMAELRRLGIVPILDLLHFGVPDWLGDFSNPELPLRFADYAEQVALRYPWVRFYTPVNEIYVCAKSSGYLGEWNEAGRSFEAYMAATKHLCAASTMAMERIVRHRPDAIMIQSESAELTTEMRVDPSREITLWNELRFLALDLLYSKEPGARVARSALEWGLTQAEYDWFMQPRQTGYQVMGIDYYGRNESMILPSGERVMGEDLVGWYGITKAYYNRFQRPLMHTETNVLDAEKAPHWLWKQWGNILRMRGDGIPVLGFTWYSLLDQIDWDTKLVEHNGTVNPCGLYDLDRKRRPVAAAYRQLIEEYGRIALVPHGDLFTLTDQPARLTVDL